ncbi:MAG: dockerin type I domain-containing protein [Pirellulaceae bacterium]
MVLRVCIAHTRRCAMRSKTGLQRRRMLVEPLESRQLLAADFPLFHNFQMPEDVDNNGVVAPLDALRGINVLSGFASSVDDSLLDVNADGRLTPVDPLIVLNSLNLNNLEVRESIIPVERRIARIREAIETNRLPPAFSIDRASEILETLRHGGRPELGEIIRPERLQNLRDRITGESSSIRQIVRETLGIDVTSASPSDVASVIDGIGVDLAEVVQSVERVIDALPEEASQLGDRVLQFLNDLGEEGSNLGQQIQSLLDTPEVQQIIDGVESFLSDADFDLDGLSQRLRVFVADIDADGTSLRDALLNLIDGSVSDAQPFRDRLVAILQSDQFMATSQDVRVILDRYNIDIQRIEQAIDRFAARLDAGENPVRDWIVRALASPQPNDAVARLRADAGPLGDNIDDLIDSITDDVSGIEQAVETFVDDLLDDRPEIGNLVDDIFERIGSGDSISELINGGLSGLDQFLTDLFDGDDFLDSLFDRLF